MKLCKNICTNCVERGSEGVSKGTVKTWDAGYVVCPHSVSNGLFSNRYITKLSDGPKEKCPWILEHVMVCH